jgi:organic hydroperoxide reductase OsmC/OhrA
MELDVESVDAVAEGDLDLRGTLGIDRDVAVGFERIRLRLELSAPRATDQQLRELCEKTERYCVVLHTLQNPPVIEFAQAS